MALMEECWIVLDASGDVIAEAETHQDAIGWALERGLSPVVDDIELPEEGRGMKMAANPAFSLLRRGEKSDAPLQAKKTAVLESIPRQHFESREMQREAWRVLRDYFPSVHGPKRTKTTYTNSPGDLWDAWLGGNFKTEKAVMTGLPAAITALSLMPYDRWWSMMTRFHRDREFMIYYAGTDHPVDDPEWAERFVELTGDLYQRLTNHPMESRGFTHCIRSNRFCRESCLSETGQNTITHNYVKKFVLTTLLHQHPNEFSLMLARSIKKHADGAAKRGEEPMVRLNTFSDLPWEDLAPWLFEAFAPDRESPVTFYDYTKLPGRGPSASPVGNYDITFSFSGRNQKDCWDELVRGTRLAVVFAGNDRPMHGDKVLWPDPYSSRGDGIVLEVSDAGEDDARPRNPLRSIASLPYKVPHLGGVKARPKAFVVQAYRHPHGYYVIESHLPRQTNFESGEG
jgi:hypothetical protein